MKKISILLLTALSCSFALLSCGFNDLQTPKEVKVRTDATYEFSVMNFDSEKEGSKLKLSKYFDFEKTLEEKTASSSDSDSMQIYKYNDGSQFQQFLIHMPLDEVDFDFSESFKEMDFAKSMEDFNVNEEIPIPEIEEPEQNEPINLDDVHKQLNRGVKFGGDSTGDNLPVNFQTVNDGEDKLDFTSITYSSGTLVVSGIDSILTGTVQLFNGSIPIGEPVSFVNGKANIDLTNVQINKTGMKLTFSDHGKKFIAMVEENSKIKEAAGIYLAGKYKPVVTPSTVTFPFELKSNIKSCEVTDGSLEVKINRPGGWSSVIKNYTIDLSGGVTASFDKDNTTETYTNSNKLTLVNGDIVATPTITVTINDATMDFENGPSVYAKVTINTVNAVVKLEDGYKTEIIKQEDVSDSMKQYVERIYWNPSGFNILATNDLPSGNDITLKFNSNFFKMTNVEDDIVAEGEGATPTLYETFRGTSTITKFVDSGSGEKFEKIDLKGNITLPGYDEAENTITVTNVVPGKKYHLIMEVEPVFDWEKADVKLGDTSGLNDKMNTGMNKNTLFSVLGSEFARNVKIREMPVYIYGTIPDGLTDANEVEGVVKTYYVTESAGNLTSVGETPVYVIGSAGATEDTFSTIPIESTLPTLTPNESGEIGAISGIKAGDFANSMNVFSETGTLCIDYNIRIKGNSSGTIVITPDDIADAQDPANQKSTKIKMDIIMLLTMDFNVTAPTDIDMLDMASKKGSDLLGRSEATDTSSYKKYMDVVKSATISIEKFNIPMTGDVSLCVDIKNDGNVVTKPVGNGETFAIEVKPSDIIESYPFSPDMKFRLEQGNFGILRTMPISGKIKLKVKAKGDIPIYPFSEQN